MPKNNEVNWFSKSFAEPNPGLKSYFGKVVKGQPKVYDTPFARGESTEALLAEWDTVLKSIDEQWPSLYAFEKDLANKVGPMSVQKPLSERISDIDHYYEDILLPSKPISSSAVAAVVKEFAMLRGMEPRGQKKTLESMKLSTNSGSPFFTKRRNVVDQTLYADISPEDYLHPEIGQALTPANGRLWPIGDKANYWGLSAVLGWRGQEGGPSSEDVKQRVVWMFPFGLNLLELTVYQPLIEGAQKSNLVPAWVSTEAVDRRITDMFDTKSDDDLIVCTDFSKFDQHFNNDMQKAAQSVLTAILNTSRTSKEWLNYIYPIKYTIPLAYDWNKVRFGKHGMASGSGGTNCDETLAHRALQYEAAQNAGAKLNPNSQCLGDDGILTYPGITVEDVVKAYSSHGQEMNPDKQYASTHDCVYLRRWHHKDYRIDGVCAGVYSTNRALGRLRYLERYMDPKYWDAKAVALRQLAILENVKNHPLKEEFVDFCMKRDKYRLGIDIPHFLDEIETVAKEKMEHMPDFLGYTRSLQSSEDDAYGIANWWIVKYLKSKM